MSLVSDALRKARQEAAEREGRRGAPRFPAAMVHPPRGSRLGLGLVLGATITLLAAAGGGVAAWWLLGAGDHTPASAAAGLQAEARTTIADPGAAQAAAGSDMPTVAEETTPQPAAGSADQVDARRSPDAPPTASAPARARSAAPADELPDVTAQAEPTASVPSSAPAGQRARGQTPRTGPRDFVAEADLGYATLTLDYIAYRPSDPFAQINGIELHEGSHVEGFTVERIARDRVELRDDRGPLVLRVR